jgi:hypothetical protein
MITNSGVILFFSNECIARLRPQIEFNLNLPPVLGSGKDTMHIGLLMAFAKFRRNLASVKVV